MHDFFVCSRHHLLYQVERAIVLTSKTMAVECHPSILTDSCRGRRGAVVHRVTVNTTIISSTPDGEMIFKKI